MFFNIIDVFAIQQQELFFTMEEIIVIASKYPEELWESIASVEVITEEEINNLPSENLAGIIKNIAGLEIMDYGSPGDIKAISIRGSSPEQVLVMIDGQIVNDPQTGKIDLGLIPSDIIGKIEIYRGPASALYGANALGGVINIITKSGKGEKKGTAVVHYGTYHTQKYQASYQGQSDNMSYYFTGQYYKTNGDRGNSHLDNISFMGKISREINQQSDLDLTIRYCDYERGLPGPLEYPTPLAQQNDRDFNLNLKWQKREEDRDLNILTWYNFHWLYYDDPEEWGYTGPSIHKAYSSGISFDSTHYNFNFGRENEVNSNDTLTWGGELINNIISSTDIGNHQAINGALFVQSSWRPVDEDD
jgi:outer membrane receptor for ferrienterochelin and colicins